MSLPVIDATSHGSNIAVSPLTVSHTVISGTHSCLVVWVSVQFASTAGSCTCTYNGVSMTLDSSLAQGTNVLFKFSLLAVSAGTANIVGTSSGGGGQSAMTICAYSWTNVDQSTPFGTHATNSVASATSISNTVTTTSSSNQVALDGILTQGSSLTATASQTVDAIDTSGAYDAAAAHITATGSNMMLSWSWTTAIAAVEISVAMNGFSADSLATTPGSLTFHGAGSQNVNLQNTGSSNDNITTSIVGASTWLSVSPTSFNGLAAGNNTNFSVSVSPGALGPGTYNDTVRFSSNNGAIANVPVTFNLPLLVGGPITPGAVIGPNIQQNPGWPYASKMGPVVRRANGRFLGGAGLRGRNPFQRKRFFFF